MNDSIWGPPILRLIAMCIPLTFGLAALFVPRTVPLRRSMQAASLAGALALVVAIVGATIPQHHTDEFPPTFPRILVDLAQAVRLDVITHVMLVLVCFIAIVIARYSRPYLHGDIGQRRYTSALLATLGAVTLLVVSNNLLVITLAWMGTSLALHQLLTFYRDRRPALMAAHKKFLLSRLADACMLGAIGIIGLTVGSLDLDVLHAWARTHGSLPRSLQLAAVLLAIAASLKSAQLPFHGWLTQVMEAPTPVSALLHAGVVNIGGFVMIRLAPFMAHAPVAQTLLVVIGTTTAVVAALVMTTRVSVKVALAWSTCAQMGFMLIQCGLGAWHLALLHLVAHSLYKAHAFLSAGSAVEGWRIQAIAPRREPVSLSRILTASAVVLASVATAVALGHAAIGVVSTRPDPTLWPLTVLLGLSLSQLVARGIGAGWRPLLGVALRSILISALYFGWHASFQSLLPLPSEASTMPIGWVVVIAGFLLLFGVQILLQSRPDGRLARGLQPHLFAGLYLDELFTRVTFRLWPPRPRQSSSTSPSLTKALEAHP